MPMNSTIYPSLSLLVLRAADLDKSLHFYKSIGLEFVQEQHGTGPMHYSCTIGAMVIELYPGKPGTAPDRKNAGATMLGFQVSNLEALISTLSEQQVTIITPVQDSEWGKRAVVQDSDGRAIELS